MASHQGLMDYGLPTKVIGCKQPGIQYTERTAVRVVVKSPNNHVIVIKVNKGNYYKLPGGGVEAGEDHQQSAEREVTEETGCSVSVQGAPVATTEEYRNDLHQFSYCYIAHLLNEAGAPALTEDELADGLVHEWIHIDKALELMSQAEPTSELGRFIKERDIFLLREALKAA
ncbi:NUDIX domain-containing protein [Truncatella angustata]|uniref:NUDIX domain-containing protein n=1 Tax=Truncatella angustata TaxID=152316 RepID=A0A9P8UIA5_9PEZI|nr:NUDIX domain-containing protein [Truncatella angustata]KAH6652580.1 NUDIX domain-containing protein [Truncatella angustata]